MSHLKAYLMLALAFVGYTFPLIAQPGQKKPNIILVVADDLGYGDIGVFFQNERRQAGSLPYEMTPHIDQLANEGARFLHQYCNAPVCAPSRASLLTGVNQGNAHIRNNQFDKALEQNHTIASILKSADYATLAIGKWGLQGETETGPHWPAHPLKRGFDHFYGYMRHTDGHEHYPYNGIYGGKKEVWEDYTNVTDKLKNCYTTDLWTAYAKKWITAHEQTNANQPFFLYFAYDAPHAVLELPAQAYPDGGGLYGGVQWQDKSDRQINTASDSPDTYIYPEYKNKRYDHDNNALTPEIEWPHTYERYATANRRIDDSLGDIMQLLKDMKIDENTIIVFTSDNGPSIESYLPDSFAPNLPTFFGSYGPFDGIKRDCLEGGVRMPVIAWWPGHIPAGKLINTPSMLSDWLPTFAEMAQAQIPARSDGVSLLPSLTGQGIQEKSLVYVEYYEGGQTPDFTEFDSPHRNRRRNQMQLIRVGDISGVRYSIKTANDDFELYNVVSDPKQTRNLANLPAYKNLQAHMKEKVLQLRRADSAAIRPYDKALIAPLKVSKAKLNKGFKWAFYPGTFKWVVSEKSLKTEQKGIATTIKLFKEPYPIGMTVYRGFFQAPSDGEYDFRFSCSGKAFIRLHEATLIDADFDYNINTPIAQKVYLKKGFHPICIHWLTTQRSHDQFSFTWKEKSAMQWTNVESNLFY